MSIPRHLIALDLDGTLLNRRKQIGKATLDYLKSIKQDHVIVLATGRPYRSFIHYYRQLELSTPMVCYNGAFVTHPDNPNFPTSAYAFPKKIIQQIEADLTDTIVDNIMCETNVTIWLRKKDKSLASFFWHHGMDIQYGKLSQTLTQDPMTMIIKLRKRTPKLDAWVRSIVHKHPHLELRFWGDTPFCEIYHPQVSKGSALVKIRDHYRINPNHFLSFGDAENDKEMLELAGHGFVMKHARKTMGRYGDSITEKDHHEDGIRHELIKYFYRFKNAK